MLGAGCTAQRRAVCAAGDRSLRALPARAALEEPVHESELPHTRVRQDTGRRLAPWPQAAPLPPPRVAPLRHPCGTRDLSPCHPKPRTQRLHWARLAARGGTAIMMGETAPLGAPPPRRVLEPAASAVADPAAFEPAGTTKLRSGGGERPETGLRPDPSLQPWPLPSNPGPFPPALPPPPAPLLWPWP